VVNNGNSTLPRKRGSAASMATNGDQRLPERENCHARATASAPSRRSPASLEDARVTTPSYQLTVATGAGERHIRCTISLA